MAICNLSYAEFQNTHIEIGNLLSNLPPHDNLRVSLLRSARMNFSNRGEGDHARRCFLIEMNSSADFLWDVAFGRHGWFREKYKLWAQVKGAFSWLVLKVEKWLWGYGESPMKLIFWAGATIGLFALGYTNEKVSFVEALRISAFVFATVGYGDQLTSSTQSIHLILFESLFGLTFVGLLGASAFKWISRRQK